jgi:hypothetical protein
MSSDSEIVLPDGRVVHTGARYRRFAGYDLTGLLTGSEGTLALVTKVIVRLMRKPEAVRTFLAIYDSVDDCAATVSEITARAITPAALEMLDGTLLRMVEEATHAGYPLDAAGVLLIELEGLPKRWKNRPSRSVWPAKPATRASSAQPAAPRNATCCGKAARTPSGHRPGQPLLLCARRHGARAPRFPQLCAHSGAISSPTGSPSATSSMPATATCIPSSSSTPASRAISRRPSARASTSSNTASAWAAPSPANTASAWKRSI